MPRSSDASVTIKNELHSQWKQMASSLGYGDRGKQKLLSRMLDYAEEHRELFEIRK